MDWTNVGKPQNGEFRLFCDGSFSRSLDWAPLHTEVSNEGERRQCHENEWEGSQEGNIDVGLKR